MTIACNNAESTVAELAELRIRLAEAEAALYAIRSGASDAFIGETGGVFHLAGSDKPYATFFGAMNEGGVTLDGTGVILHGNPRFADMIGRPIEVLRGKQFLSCVSVDSHPRVLELIAKDQTASCDAALNSPDGPLPVRLSINTVDTDWQRFHCLVVTDLSVQAKIENELRGAIARQREAETRLRQREHDLHSMYTNLQSRIEAERKRVAREVHDELGQILTALRMETSMLGRECSRQDAALGRVSEMLLLIEDMFKAVRSIAGNLRPATLNLGLVPAIEWLAGDFEKRWQIDCALDIDPREFSLDDEYATATFRIIQESLTNVARHARANSVSILLRKLPNHMHIEIHDDGDGFNAESSQSSGFGLIGMKERVLELGGAMKIQSANGLGTIIFIDLPMLMVSGP